MDTMQIDVNPLGFLNLNNRPVEHTHNRSDEDIIASIMHPPPVTSEKNCWTFWDSGFANMPPWCKRNVVGWASLLGPTWVVRVLNLVPGSPAHVLKILDADNLPRHISNEQTGGQHPGPNISDTIRLPCVFQHGGVWMDAGIVLFMHLEDLCWNTIVDPRSRYEVAVASGDPSLESGLAENFFIAAPKENGFIRRWMDILREAWKGRSSNKGIHAHPLFRHLLEAGNITRVFHGASGDKLDYFQAYLAWERLRLLEDPNDGFSGANYCRNKVLLFPYQEFASAAMLTNNDGKRQFDMFCTPCGESQDLKGFQEAKEFCEHMLSRCAMMKLYRWKDIEAPTLAELWDRKENEDADCRSGTFGACMRYASRYYTQDRVPVPLKFPVAKENILVAGVVEY